jgi:hypothetical protein
LNISSKVSMVGRTFLNYSSTTPTLFQKNKCIRE